MRWDGDILMRHKILLGIIRSVHQSNGILLQARVCQLGDLCTHIMSTDIEVICPQCLIPVPNLGFELCHHISSDGGCFQNALLQVLDRLAIGSAARGNKI